MSRLTLRYSASETALSIGSSDTRILIKVKKKHGVEMSSNANYSSERLFNFLSWRQWDPLQNEFVDVETGHMVKPICVEENFGVCTSGILSLNVAINVADSGTSILYALGPGDEIMPLDLRNISFKLRPGSFHDGRPVYDLLTDTETIPYFLYHRAGKWRLGAEIGSEYVAGGTVLLEIESDAMRAEYVRDAGWYTIKSDQKSSLRHNVVAECSRQVLRGENCRSASTDVCNNGGRCRIESDGKSVCICTPGFKGTRCQHPVAHCKQSFSVEHPSFGFSNRAGSIQSTFCPSGGVRFSVCDGVTWQPAGSDICDALPAVLPANVSSADSKLPRSVRADPAAKIALVIASLVGLQLFLPFLCYCCISCCKYDENKLVIDEKLPAPKQMTKFLRACSGFFYVSWWAWIGFLMYYLCVWHGHIALDGTTIWSAVAIMAIICICLLYIVVLCESICSQEYEYLTKLKDVLLAEEQVSCMKSESLSIKFKADCWHPETRSRTVSARIFLHFAGFLSCI